MVQNMHHCLSLMHRHILPSMGQMPIFRALLHPVGFGPFIADCQGFVSLEQ